MVSVKRPRVAAEILGVLSLLSGFAILLWPARMAGIYGLPQVGLMLDVLGGRDVLIGLGILSGFGIRLFLWSRSLSEVLDAVLIALEGIRTGQHWNAVWKVAIALSAAAFTWILASSVSDDKTPG